MYGNYIRDSDMSDYIENFKAVTVKISNGDSNNHLILGNGFSMGFDDDAFNWTTLKDNVHEALQSDQSFSSQRLSEYFDQCEDDNLENLLVKLEMAIETIPELSKGILSFENPDKTVKLLTDVKIDLYAKFIDSFVTKHPLGWSNDGKEGLISNCTSNLIRECEAQNANGDVEKVKKPMFDNIFTLNYDLILYWVIQQCNDPSLNIYEDGFCNLWNEHDAMNDEFIKNNSANFRVWHPFWRNSNPNTFYLHGAAHIFGYKGNCFKLVNTGDSKLKNEIASLIDYLKKEPRNFKPSYVLEGSDGFKLKAIYDSVYLIDAYDRLKNLAGNVIVYGACIADNDEHVWKRIFKPDAKKHIYIGVHQQNNQNEMVTRVEGYIRKLRDMRDEEQLEDITFFSTYNRPTIWSSFGE